MKSNSVAATLVVCTNVGRLHFLARAARSLPEGEVIVQVKDLVGRRRAYRTRPLSPNARLVATEPPLVLRGGLTSLISYYQVPANELEATETHYDHDEVCSTYQVRLRVACRSQPADRAPPQPATPL